MKIIRNRFLPFKGFKMINLFGIIFARKEVTIADRDIQHELIHTMQIKESMYVGFYLAYLICWIYNLAERTVHLRQKRGIKLSKWYKRAYFDIPFEKEAYTNQEVKGYLESREPFAWIHYVK